MSNADFQLYSNILLHRYNYLCSYHHISFNITIKTEKHGRSLERHVQYNNYILIIMKGMQLVSLQRLI